MSVRCHAFKILYCGEKSMIAPCQVPYTSISIPMQVDMFCFEYIYSVECTSTLTSVIYFTLYIEISICIYLFICTDIYIYIYVCVWVCVTHIFLPVNVLLDTSINGLINNLPGSFGLERVVASYFTMELTSSNWKCLDLQGNWNSSRWAWFFPCQSG